MPPSFDPTLRRHEGVRRGRHRAVGRHAVDALITRGHSVTAVARSADKAKVLGGQGATPVCVSLFDVPALTKVFAAHDAVINLTSAIPPTTQFVRAKAWQENDRVRTEGSRAIVDAAVAAEVPRLLQESVSMIYPARGADWIDEEVPPDSFPLARANLVAEANTQHFAATGGIGVHMVDAASAVVAALGVPGGTFNIVDDDPLTKRDYAAALAAAAGRSAWMRPPGRGALLFGQRLTSLTRSLRVSNKRFRATSGWSPRCPNAREGWIATGAALHACP